MTYILRFCTALFFSSIIAISAYSQTSTYDDNPLYGPGPKHDPKLVAQRLSYENFRNIRLLHAALMNFGGGEAELDKLVDQYAEASALYFQGRTKESAKMFEQNQFAILETAKKLAQKYKEDSDKLLNQSIRMNVKYSLKLRLEGSNKVNYTDKFLGYAQSAVQKANDYYVRYKDATSASARELITAIYYYRIAKDNMFQMYKAMDMDDEQRKQLLDQYKRDMEDNKNKVYMSKEKDN